MKSSTSFSLIRGVRCTGLILRWISVSCLLMAAALWWMGQAQVWSLSLLLLSGVVYLLGNVALDLAARNSQDNTSPDPWGSSEIWSGLLLAATWLTALAWVVWLVVVFMASAGPSEIGGLFYLVMGMAPGLIPILLWRKRRAVRKN